MNMKEAWAERGKEENGSQVPSKLYEMEIEDYSAPIIGPIEKPNIAKRSVRSKSQAGTGAPAAAPCRL